MDECPVPQGVALGWANRWAFGPVADAGRTALRLSHPAPTGYTVVMVDAPVPKPRWYHLTPDRAVLGLLAVEGFLLLSEWCQWFAFNRHKGHTVLIAGAVVGVVFLLMLFWFLAALLFRLRFQFSIRSLLVLAGVVAIPFSWLATEMKGARKQREAVEATEKAGGSVYYDYEFDPSDDWIPAPHHQGHHGCGSCWEATCTRT